MSLYLRAFALDGVGMQEQPPGWVGSPGEQEECCGGGMRISCVRAGS